MNTALKATIGILVVIALIAAWMYYSGGAMAPSQDQGTATTGADNGNVAMPPAASGSLDDLNAAIDADVSGSQTLTSGDDSAAAAASGNTSASNAAGAVGSY